MAHGLEVRVPFLDHNYVTWTAGLPTSTKLRSGTGKQVLKEALRPLLPEDVLFRSKMGFAVPIDLWFKGSLKERIGSAVTGERLKQSRVFDPEALDRLVREHQSGKRDWSPILWALLMFEGFLQSDSTPVGVV